jgi:hypothetical protein
MKAPSMRARSVIFSSVIMTGTALITAAPQSSAPKASLNPVRIDRCEISGPFVTVHFDMEAFRKYSVQAANSARTADSNWVTVSDIPLFPFANHWVYAEYLTNAHRFFRLYVVP